MQEVIISRVINTGVRWNQQMVWVCSARSVRLRIEEHVRQTEKEMWMEEVKMATETHRGD